MRATLEDLTRAWAAGDATATDLLVERAQACLHEDDETSEPEDAALRAALARAPRFVVADEADFTAIVRAILAGASGTGDGDAGLDGDAGESDAGEPVVLDLRSRQDAGSSPRSDAACRAWLHLALLLLPADDQRRLRAFWASGQAADSSMRELVRRHMLVMTQLESGQVGAALAAAAGPRDAWGATTRWSVVLGATDPRGTVMRQSWKWLVERYRQPILAAVRRRLAGAADAEEAAQDFIAYLFEHNVLAKVDPQGGRFRAYLQAVLRRYLLGRHRRDHRGARPLDDAVPAMAADDALTRLEEREWAEHVLRLALGRVGTRLPRAAEILVLRYGLGQGSAAGGGAEPMTREALAARFAMNLDAVDQACSRARRLLRECLRQELLETVDTTAEVDVEQRWLEAMLAGRPDAAALG